MSGHLLKVIVPLTSLPAEGSEPQSLQAITDDGTEAGQLFSQLTAMTRLIGDAALVLNAHCAADAPPAAMETVTFATDENAEAHFEFGECEETETIENWGTKAFARALERYRASCVAAFDGSDCERFAESLAIAFNETGSIEEGGASGEVRRVPLLAERDGQVIFYGVWEATGDELEVLAKTWSGDAASGWLPIGDDDEVEGRGVREAVLGLAAFGLVAASMPGDAIAGDLQAAAAFDVVDANDGEFDYPRPEMTGSSTLEEKTSIKPDVGDMGKTLDLTDFEAPNSEQAGARIDLIRLANSTKGNTRIIVDVGAQRAFISVDGLVIGDMPVSTARSGKYTPRGTFCITQKKVDKVSTIYHVALPYWMRLDQSAIGLHVGDLPGRPASAGCIRLPEKVAQKLFSHVQSGTPVDVVDTWSSRPHWILAGS